MFWHENNSIDTESRNNDYQEIIDLLQKKCSE